MDEKDVPEIVLWERYLVYATVFGISDKVIKSMNIRLQKMETLSNNDVSFQNLYLNHILLNHALTSSINSTVESAISSSMAKIASSNTTSSSGFGGGGFSSGGGFGGGGGGGHGF